MSYYRQSLDEQVEQHEKYKALVDKAVSACIVHVFYVALCIHLFPNNFPICLVCQGYRICNNQDYFNIVQILYVIEKYTIE